MKIRMVKFYQGVNIDMKTNMNSMSVIEKRDASNKQIVSIEKTQIGVLIKTEDASGRIGYTEIPFNNLAYINYEPGQVGVPTASVAAPLADPSPKLFKTK